MDLELSGRCEKDRLVIEDGRATLQSGLVSQVFFKSKTTFALVFFIPLHSLCIPFNTKTLVLYIKEL